MSSSWGNSWGLSWGVSWGYSATPVDPDVTIIIYKPETKSVSGFDGSAKTSIDRKPILRQTILEDADLLGTQLRLEDEELVGMIGLLITSGII